MDKILRLKERVRIFVLGLMMFAFSSGFAQITYCGISLQDTSGCAPFLLLGTAQETTTFPIVERLWTLRTCAGAVVYTTPVGLNPNFSYILSNAGCYCLVLFEKDQNGNVCSDSICNITVALNPTINFTFTPVEGCQPLLDSLICNSLAGSGTITSITVDWGCGATTTYPNCAALSLHQYSGCLSGYLSPSVVVNNSFGCYADTTYANLIHLIPDPVANFTADTTIADCATGPLTVNFTATYADPNITYCWYVNNVQQQCSTSLNFTYSFPISNNCYDVKLVVRHPSGCADSLTKTGYICVRTTPLISFNQNVTTMCVPGTLQLTNTSPGIPNVTWTITGPANFGPYTGSTYNVNITQPGTYTLTESGVFSAGCSNSITQQVLVANAPPVATFTAVDTYSCGTPFAVAYTPGACVGCSYYWYSPGGSPFSSTLQNPTITYNAFGTYTVWLIETAANGCKDTLIKNNYIRVQRLNPQISSNHYKGCGPVCTTLQNATNTAIIPVPIDSVCWSFPGSNIPGACQDTIQRCFTTPGCYSVKLRITTTTGCVDTITLVDTLCVGIHPTCTLAVSPDTLCFEEDSVKFTLSCDSFSYIVVKDFGDGEGGLFYTNNFYHFYEDTGYLCAIIIPVKDSCPGDTLRPCVQVNPPVAKFTDSFSCASKDTVYLFNRSLGYTSYEWHFCTGDSSNTNPGYKVLGYCDTCRITLDAYNSQTGCHHHQTQVISTPCDEASFTPDSSQVCAPASIVFVNTSPTSTTTFTRWDWDANDSVSFRGPNAGPGNSIRNTFTTPGVYRIAMQNLSAGGCIDTAIGLISVCNVSAHFWYDTTCFPAAICFHDSSLAFCSPTVWHWTFGDGTTDSIPNPCHAYSQPGVYQVKLAIYSGPCSDSMTLTVATSNIISLDYSIDTFICPNVLYCIHDNSAGNNLTFNWTMPGASPSTTSTLEAPCITYNTPGDYYIYFDLSSNGQCHVYDTTLVHVDDPIAGGYPSITFLPCPNPPTFISFIDTSQYADSTWHWSFDDGTYSDQKSPTHLYLYPGIYIDTLSVMDKQGCINTAIIDTIQISGPFGQFTMRPLPGICACQDSMYYSIATYNATSLTIVYGCNQGFLNVNPILPIGTITNPTVINVAVPFCVLDTCQPQLVFGDSAGCIVSVTTLPYFYVDSPTVNFTFNNYGVCQSGTICFSDSTIYHLWPYQSYTTGRLWDFGDGTTDTVANPCHFFGQPGGYMVHLYIQSNLGCSDSIVKLVVVPSYPIAGYFADDSQVCAHTPICFHDTSQIDTLTAAQFWVWDFGDGSPLDTVYTATVCHAYANGGNYRVTMCVTDSLGCSDCDSSTVMQVIPNPIASAGGNTTVCYNVPTQLTGTGGQVYTWSPPGVFSNPDTSSPFITLLQDTTITLIAADNLGCADTATARITVARVTANFNLPANVCLQDSVCLTDASSDLNGTVDGWVYSFGDGVTASGQNVCHLYTTPGNYNITEVATDNHGCLDSITKSITIFPSPKAAFKLNDTIICSNQQICATDLSTSTIPITNWLWEFGDNATDGGNNPPCHTYARSSRTEDTLTLVVTDQNGCVDSASIVVTVHSIPTANFNWATSCEDDSMPLSNTSIAGSAPISNCVWVIWLGAQNPLIDSNCYTSYQFPPGIHPVELAVTDLNGCSDTIIQSVVTDSLSKLVIYPGDTIICLGTAVDYHVSGVFNSITWTPSIWLSDPNASVVTINPLSSTGYVISATNGVCASASDTFAIYVIQPIPIEVSATPQRIVLGLSSNITSQIPGQIDSIVWYPDSTLDCRDCQNPVATPHQTTTYYATIFYSQDGVTCTNTAQVTIDVLNNCDQSIIYLPNTFTPNGDGINDIFMIRGIAATKIHSFRVFDRWGKIVFEAVGGVANDPKWGWDGNDEQGKKLNPEVYVYTYEIECINGNIVTGQGNVTLVR